MKYFIITASILMLITMNLSAQHGISPGYAFIDESSRQVNITIFNQSDEEKEAEVSLKFGYPIYEDSLGNTVMHYNDSVNLDKFGLDKRVRVFPKKVILPARSQQTTRFVLTGSTDDLPEGTMWSRISVKTIIKKKQIESTDKEGIQVGFDIAYETTTILMLQKGNLTTGLELCEVEVRDDSLNYYLLIDTKKQGNSPYIGMYELNIKDSENNELEPVLGSYVIYFDAKPGIKIPKEKLPTGEYTATLKVHNERPDFDKDKIIKTEPILKTFTFNIDGSNLGQTRNNE
jgi:hypothetical protein